MALDDLTYVFEGNEAYAFSNGRILASAQDLDELEAKLAAPHAEGCDCGFCQNKGSFGKKDEEEETEEENEAEKENEKTATHVVTPNGLRGKILGRHEGVWGDSVTVRFENGRIVQFPVQEGLKFSKEAKIAEKSFVEGLQERLAETTSGDRESLIGRSKELKGLRREAQTKISEGVSYQEEQALDELAVQADHELAEVVDAIEHLDDENVEAYAPPEPQVFEQETMGDNNGSWLEDTFRDMVNEADATDWDKLMAEGPEAFVAEADEGALADTGATRALASSFIRSKTAGANENARGAFEEAWLERIESVRREELKNRQTKVRKEAAKEEDYSDAPDDVLFG